MSSSPNHEHLLVACWEINDQRNSPRSLFIQVEGDFLRDRSQYFPCDRNIDVRETNFDRVAIRYSILEYRKQTNHIMRRASLTEMNADVQRNSTERIHHSSLYIE